MASKRRIAKTPTEAVGFLWEDKFFRGWQKIAAVDEALAKVDNHFSPASLDMALKRADYLTRRGKPRKYEYIQKYPYAPESEPPASKKGGKK